jgi:hypothetical protein
MRHIVILAIGLALTGCATKPVNSALLNTVNRASVHAGESGKSVARATASSNSANGAITEAQLQNQNIETLLTTLIETL